MKIKETRVLPPVPVPQRVGVTGGDPEDTEIRKKREKIKEVMSWGWWYEWLQICVWLYVMCCSVFTVLVLSVVVIQFPVDSKDWSSVFFTDHNVSFWNKNLVQVCLDGYFTFTVLKIFGNTGLYNTVESTYKFIE